MLLGIGNEQEASFKKQEQDRGSLLGESFDGGFFVLLIVRFS